MGERGLANVLAQPTQAALKEYVQIKNVLKHSIDTFDYKLVTIKKL